MAKIPPPPAPPPAKKKGNPYDNYIAAHPGLKPWAQQIRNDAVAEGIDPLYFAALINLESGGHPGAVSSAGAIGLAQIEPGTGVGAYAPWLGRRLTRADLDNPAINLRFGAYYFAQALKAHGGNYAAAYNGADGIKGATYNPGYKGNPFAGLPAPSGGYSPIQKAQNAQEQAAAKQTLTDPWVVIRNGKVRYVNSPTAPKGAVTSGGLPLTRSQFLDGWHQLNDVYEAYTGKTATAQQAAQALQRGTSVYHLQLTLSQTPAFRGSPVWKSRAPDYVAAWKSVYGNNSKPDVALIGKAIVQNLSGDGFHELLRERPDYVQSNEFKQGVTSMQSVYESIYGATDDNSTNAIKQATLAGWTPDQFAAYLRKLPEYSTSNEYHQKALTFLDALGLITGQVSTLQPGTVPAAQTQQPNPLGPPDPWDHASSPYAPAPGLPYDPRAPRAAAPTGPGAGLTPTQ